MRVFDLVFDVLMVVLVVMGVIAMWSYSTLATMLLAAPAGAYAGTVVARLMYKAYN